MIATLNFLLYFKSNCYSKFSSDFFILRWLSLFKDFRWFWRKTIWRWPIRQIQIWRLTIWWKEQFCEKKFYEIFLRRTILRNIWNLYRNISKNCIFCYKYLLNFTFCQIYLAKLSFRQICIRQIVLRKIISQIALFVNIFFVKLYSSYLFP